MRNKISVVILAAGLDKRFIKFKPRLTQLVNNESLISRHVTTFSKTKKCGEIVVVVGANKEAIARELPYSDIKVIENTKFHEYHESYSIKLGLDNCTNNEVLIVYGDYYYDNLLLNKINNTSQYSKIFIDVGDTLRSDGVGVSWTKEKVQNLGFEFKDKWSGLVLLKRKELGILRQVLQDETNYYYCGHEILNKVIADHGKFIPEVTSDEAFEIDTKRDYDKLREFYAS